MFYEIQEIPTQAHCVHICALTNLAMLTKRYTEQARIS